MHVVFNLLLGLLPALSLGAAMASDEKKGAGEERIVADESDRRRQTTIFLLVFGLWGLTLAMWNWMRSYPRYWMVIWGVLGVVALVAAWRRRGR